MKLFGGGGDRRKTAPEKPQKNVPVQQNTVKTAPKPQKAGGIGKKKPTKEQKRKRIIVAVSIITVLAVVLGVAIALFVRPPQIQNDPTIKDAENGDVVQTSNALNGGERIADVFTFVVCATDEDGTRTDAIMVVTFDTKKKSINVMNIPRDTMSNVSRSGAARKINAAYGTRKNIEQTKEEVELLMGFKPDKYIIVNFDGIAQIVDAIGGVDYEIPFRMQYDDPSQNLHIDLYAGMQHLDGKQTVEFLRWRKNNPGVSPAGYENGDEGRVAKQQEFLKYLAGQVLTMQNASKIPSIADKVFANVKTDLTAGEVLWIGLQAAQVKNDNIKMFTLPGYGAMSTAGGDSTPYSFYFPYYQETLDLVNQYFNPYATPITALSMVDGPTAYSYSGGGGGSSYEPADDYTWGDTNTESTETAPAAPSTGNGDPESGVGTVEGSTPESGTTGGEATGGENVGSETAGGETTGGETTGGEITQPAETPAETPAEPEPAPSGSAEDPEG